jgi:hypothetical protein
MRTRWLNEAHLVFFLFNIKLATHERELEQAVHLVHVAFPLEDLRGKVALGSLLKSSRHWGLVKGAIDGRFHHKSVRLGAALAC